MPRSGVLVVQWRWLVAMVHVMSNSSADPSGNTEQFQAFARRESDGCATEPSRTPLLVGVTVAMVVVLAVVLVLAVR